MRLDELARALGAELRPPFRAETARGAPTAAPVFAEANTTGGSVFAETNITGVAGIEEAGPAQITFVANPKYAPLAQSTCAGAILVEPDFPPVPIPSLRLANPYHAFARALEIFYQAPHYGPGIHPTAVVDPSAQIGEGVHIGPYVVVGAGAVIGAHSVLLAHVVIYDGVRTGTHLFAHAHSVVREHCILGNHVTLGNGTIVGSDGFGFAKDEAGAWYKIPQTGPAVLEDYVEIQALSAIDRSSVGETRIGEGVKIDNLVQVGHGSSVGARTLLCSQVGLAGSTHIGRNAILAGQAGVAGHCHVGDGVIITAQSGTHGDIPAGAVMSGSPAFANRQWLRATAAFQRLPETLRKLQKSQNGKDL
jgi:UDP-3-O-[3-hydroxymyristoyl] glucosamine N-acyltransferase